MCELLKAIPGCLRYIAHSSYCLLPDAGQQDAARLTSLLLVLWKVYLHNLGTAGFKTVQALSQALCDDAHNNASLTARYAEVHCEIALLGYQKAAKDALP